MQNTTTLIRPLYPNLVIPAQPAFVQAQAGTQTSPNPEPSFAEIQNPVYLANPVNLVKILTVKNSANQCQKIFSSPSNFFKNSGRPNPTCILPILPILTFLPFQNMSKTCQKWSISCQK
ncbi:hypothetical protein ACFL02_06915 [Planctomycetota bacterium]